MVHNMDTQISVLLQSLVSGEEGREVKYGRSEAYRPLNRFKNITTCEFIKWYALGCINGEFGLMLFFLR